MSLFDRLQATRASGTENGATATGPDSGTIPTEPHATERTPASTLSVRVDAKAAADAEARQVASLSVVGVSEASSNALRELKEQVTADLYDRVGARIADSNLDEAQLQDYVRTELRTVVAEQQVPLTSTERDTLINEVMDDVLGLGPIQRFIDDPSVTEVMVNRADQVYFRSREA